MSTSGLVAQGQGRRGTLPGLEGAPLISRSSRMNSCGNSRGHL
jgi:hypothetical protein